MLQAPTKKYDNEFKLLGTKLNYLSTAVRDLGKDKADIARFEEVESKMTAHNLQM